MITFADLTEPAAAGAERCVDRQLWLACAGGMCTVPPVGASVYYFPQGHAEHALGLAGAADLSAARVPALVPCRVTAVRYMADPDTDEVFARIRLVPLRGGDADADAGGVEDDAAAADEQEKPASFAKTLTQSDANNGGGFSVPRYCAETIFPRLDYAADPPVQTVVAKDVHGAAWKFRHIYRGTPRRHLLTTGWSTFVNQKKLVAGDSIVFLRGDSGDLHVGIRRAKRGFCGAGGGGGDDSPAAGWDHYAGLMRGNVSPCAAAKARGKVRPEDVAEAARLAAAGQSFEVVYYPRASTPEFCVRAAAVRVAMRVQWSPGMRFKMAFETEDSSRISWFMGTVAGVQVTDPIRWPQSPWRLLQVCSSSCYFSATNKGKALRLVLTCRIGDCAAGDLGRAGPPAEREAGEPMAGRAGVQHAGHPPRVLLASAQEAPDPGVPGVPLRRAAPEPGVPAQPTAARPAPPPFPSLPLPPAPPPTLLPVPGRQCSCSHTGSQACAIRSTFLRTPPHPLAAEPAVPQAPPSRPCRSDDPDPGKSQHGPDHRRRGGGGARRRRRRLPVRSSVDGCQQAEARRQAGGASALRTHDTNRAADEPQRRNLPSGDRQQLHVLERREGAQRLGGLGGIRRHPDQPGQGRVVGAAAVARGRRQPAAAGLRRARAGAGARAVQGVRGVGHGGPQPRPRGAALVRRAVRPAVRDVRRRGGGAAQPRAVPRRRRRRALQVGAEAHRIDRCWERQPWKLNDDEEQ
uniref:Auxin response factor n=1 Tax=Zea mays TaxID=4577 RepID=A0A804NTL3_MAIZE